jgi:type II secretory pathway component PulF
MSRPWFDLTPFFKKLGDWLKKHWIVILGPVILLVMVVVYFSLNTP